jgi:oligopeptide/dipeptide ABC transporter ATP-binding protein
MPEQDAALTVEDLSIQFTTPQGTVYAVNHVNLDLHRGTITALLGETGSGKSVTGRAMLGLIDGAGRITSGRVMFRGVDMLRLRPRHATQIRGRDIAMVFQDARATLNPLIPIGEQVARVARVHSGLGRRQAKARAVSVLQSVGIADASHRLKMYPHQLSGGLNQRVMLATALICDPEVVVADEPTTGLDVTVQSQVVKLLRRSIVESDRACLFITHDIGVAAEVSDEISVMYGGVIVERGPTSEILARPQHPYTEALLRSALPVWSRRKLVSIPGAPHEMSEPPGLCTFLDRCSVAVAACRETMPPFVEVREGQFSRCHLLVPATSEGAP